MDCEGAAAGKPHVVCFPATPQSHMKAMLDLAKLLYHRGFHVTFVITETNHRRLLKSNSFDGLPAGFRFEAIPEDYNETRDLYADIEDSRNHFLAPLRDLVTKLNHSATSNVPPVTCMVSDGFILISSIVAQELRIPIASLFTISACALMACTQFRALKDNGLIPLKDESDLTNGYLDQVVDSVPGMKDIRLRDFPSYVRTTDPDDVLFEFSIEVAEKASKSSAIIVHTFDALDRDVLDALSSTFPPTYAVGPLSLLVKEIPGDSPVKSFGHSPWKEDTECLQWLDSMPHNSVIYVNFGSAVVMKREQVLEFCWGLANSKQPFLWIIRPGLVSGDAAILPPEFVAETKERGMVTSWCSQEQVLNHQSVGGFLTHCGWNSTIESISAGVPMLCWPVFGDQQTNCRYTCREWGIGMEIDSNLKREEVGELVRELMEGEKGKKMRSKAMEWKRKAEEAIGVHGSSFIALDNLVNKVLLSKECIASPKSDH